MELTSLGSIGALKLDEAAPDRELHADLVTALYATPRSMLSATLAAVAVTWIAGRISADPAFALSMFGFLLVGFARVGANLRFLRQGGLRPDLGDATRWERIAMAGAWSFAALVGLTGAYAIVVHTGSATELLIVCCVIGYIAGISSRNASRPLITIGQISATCVPFLAALVVPFDLVHLTLALFIAALYASTIVMCRRVYDTIVARHHAQRKLERLALRDPLTNLLNRSAFFDAVERALSALDGRTCLGLIAIDLDRFKDVNDTLGHPSGDRVLLETARRLRQAVGPSDDIARIGGDEFLILVRTPDVAHLRETATRLGDVLQDPHALGITTLVCGASLGYAAAPWDGTTLDDLMRHADLALYEAKRRGGGKVVGYDQEFSRVYQDQMELIQDLQQALDRDELVLNYQPIVDHRTGRILCFEALLRWNHPRRGLVPPSIFIPLAEATGLIGAIGAWVLEEACREAKGWPSDIKVAVNLSPLQFENGAALIETVIDVLSRTGLCPERLELEVTENVLIKDTMEALATIKTLRRHGVGVSLDDFGSGFSSLGYLQEFPFSKLKLDRIFSRGVHDSERSVAIIRGIVQIARDLRIDLVAEGIETRAQLAQIARLGVHAIQGYLFSRPVLAEDVRTLLDAPAVPLSEPEPTLPRRRAAKTHTAA